MENPPPKHTLTVSTGPRSELILNPLSHPPLYLPHPLHRGIRQWCSNVPTQWCHQGQAGRDSSTHHCRPPPNPTWLKQARFWFPCHISVSTAEWYIGLPTLTQQKQWMLWLPCPGVISRSRSMLSLHPTWQQRLNEPMISGAHHHSASYPHSSVNGAQKRTGIKR